MRAALAKRGRSDAARSASVFASREAEELERVLAAIDEQRTRSTIGRRSHRNDGRHGEALHALHADERAWEDGRDFSRSAAMARDGICTLLRGGSASQGPHDCSNSGRRAGRTTSEYQELLQRCRGKASPAASRGSRKASDPKERTRASSSAESDENLVNISPCTSRRLSPVVFCRHGRHSQEREGRVIRFHEDGAASSLRIRELEDSRQHRCGRARGEPAPLYVALTECQVPLMEVWGNIARETSPRAGCCLRTLTRAARPRVPRPALAEERQVQRTGAHRGGRRQLRVSPLPAEKACASAASGSRTDFRRARTGSRDTMGDELPALAHGRSIRRHLRIGPRAASERGRRDILRSRARSGWQCLHAIFEEVRFREPRAAGARANRRQGLALHGFEASGCASRRHGAAVIDPARRTAAVARGAAGAAGRCSSSTNDRVSPERPCAPCCARRITPTKSQRMASRVRAGARVTARLPHLVFGRRVLLLADYSRNGWAGGERVRAIASPGVGRAAYYLQYTCIA